MLSNSLKFTFNGHIKIKATLANCENANFSRNEDNIENSQQHILSLEESSAMQVLFAVEDTGIGIKKEDHEKLFKMFGKVGQNEELNPNGIGLGLTICNKILSQLGGELQVKSEYQQGSSFYFTLDFPAADTQNISRHEFSFTHSRLSPDDPTLS